MRPFEFVRAESAQAAILAATQQDDAAGRSSGQPSSSQSASSQFLAGGTTLLDLMKLDVMRPARVIDINDLRGADASAIEVGPRGLRLGAMVRMSDAAAHEEVRRNFPVIAQSLALAASQQLRNMATLGGNVLQRTRCTYFRDTSYPNCNKRNPGSGCAARDGVNRMHAVLGTSEHCIATYPGDFAQALIALDAQVELTGSNGRRELPFAKLHRLPATSPQIETTLQPGELITAFRIAPTRMARRSLYLKIRDRESYEFALASAAVALDIDGGIVKDARIALGGVATVPWRSEAAEGRLRGWRLDDQAMQEAADAAFADASARAHNAFKIKLGKQTLQRALRQAAALEI
jgi:xanthine dehydrogenase YagS FAD-binding subunit